VSPLAVVSVALAIGAPVHSETASHGPVRATVSYVQLHGSRGTWYTRLVVDRGGAEVYDGRVPSPTRYSWKQPVGVFGHAPTITLRDLDGDGEPEILLDFWIGGAHCCEWTRIYRWDSSTGSYSSFVHWWGDPTYRLEHLPGSDGADFVSYDDRFAYAFASFAGSGMPVQIWAYRRGRLVEVTNRYPALVRRDAARYWRYYVLARRGKGETSGLLAAWAADECRLGRGGKALQWIDAHRYVLTPWEYAGSRAPFARRLSAFLRRRGYDC
jgi:hypothetical protein